MSSAAFVLPPPLAFSLLLSFLPWLVLKIIFPIDFDTPLFPPQFQLVLVKALSLNLPPFFALGINTDDRE